MSDVVHVAASSSNTFECISAGRFADLSTAERR